MLRTTIFPAKSQWHILKVFHIVFSPLDVSVQRSSSPFSYFCIVLVSIFCIVPRNLNQAYRTRPVLVS